MADAVHATNPLAGMLQQRRWQVVIIVIALLLAGGAGYLIRGSGSTANGERALPTTLPLPAHATLTRTEHFLSDQFTNWYYTVPNMDDDAISMYYQAQLPRHGWHCVMVMKSINSTVYGQQYTASNIYITALNGGTKLQLYTAGGDYGAYLLQDDVPDDAAALKISLEPAKVGACPGTSTP